MPPSHPLTSPTASPPPAPSRPADASTHASEYIPPTNPPALPSSESMRRIRDMLAAGKLAVDDELTFSYADVSFRASVTPTGALSAPAPRPAVADPPVPDAPPTRLSHNVRKLYSSPSDFANDMARVAVYADPRRAKPRGDFSVNGWDACKVRGRALAHIRNEMLLQKKPTMSVASPTPSPVPPSPTDLLTADGANPVSTAPDDAQADKQADRLVDDGKAPSEVPNPPELEARDSKADRTEGLKVFEEAGEEKKEEPKPDRLAGSFHDSTVGDSASEPLDRSVVGDADAADLRRSDASEEEGGAAVKGGEDAQKPSDKDNPGDEDAGRTRTTAIDSTAPDEVAEVKHASNAANSVAAHEFADAGEGAKAKQSPEAPLRSEVTHESLLPGTEGALEKDEAQHARAPTTGDAPMSPLGDKTMERKRKAASASKEPNKKRKRSEVNESSTVEAVTPPRGSEERSTRPRADLTDDVKKPDISSTSDVNAGTLDPDAIEAAAIAAQAEKEEAHNRARRTTRLAAGKIKQVDYKASANAQSVRDSSPGPEDDEGNPFQSQDSAAEPTKSSKRRAATQSHLVVPQRSSRRVARMRGSQDRDPSSNEEAEHMGGRNSSLGSGSDGRAEVDGQPLDAMDVDAGAPGRANGARGEGKERKRTRSDVVARRTRHNQTEHSDGDGDDRQHYGTRSSTRGNSVGDVADMASRGDPSEKGEAEEDEMDTDDDPEARVGTHGWNMTELVRIGTAVDNSGSLEQARISSELYSEGNWTSNEEADANLAAYIKTAVSCIASLKTELLPNDTDGVTVAELRAFIATDVWRLKTGGIIGEYPRTTKADHRRVEGEEQRKLSLDRLRRKLQRESEELRNKLDADMELRRKAELEAGYVELQLAETSHQLPREKRRRQQLEMEIERYQMMRVHSLNQLEKTKLLVSRLRGERDGPDGIPAMAKEMLSNPLDTNAEVCENGVARKGEVEGVGESVTYEDDVEMSNKEEESVSERQQDMERFRLLIAAREAEAEALHRSCEALRMSFVSSLDAKNRLESELYLQKPPHGGSVSGGGTVQHVLHPQRAGKESRKGDSRHTGAGTHRPPGAPRPKPNGSKTNGAHAQSTAVPKPSVSHKAKSVQNKASEQSRKVKRNGSSKPQGGGSGEKQ